MPAITSPFSALRFSGRLMVIQKACPRFSRITLLFSLIAPNTFARVPSLPLFAAGSRKSARAVRAGTWRGRTGPSQLNYPAWRISWVPVFSPCEPFMRFIAILLLTGLFAGLVPAAASAAGRPKVALVIGNAKYPDADSAMNDISNDSQDMADELK